jgi:DNA-binding HxlR family transcriptional regulator
MLTCRMQVTRESGRKGAKPTRQRIRASRPRFARSPCPIASLLDLVGDKWSLLLIRDLLHASASYSELLASPEGIPTNILAERLKRLERSGIITKTPYQKRPLRFSYSLTKKGRDLRPVLVAFMRWANQHLPGVSAMDLKARAKERRALSGR